MDESLSVVIPAYNAASMLGAQLEALAGQHDPGPFEVIVVDNGSTDDTADVARRWCDRLDLQVVTESATRGVSAARNAGLRATTTSRLLICDADDVVGERWIAAMRHALQRGQLASGPILTDRLNTPEAQRWRPAMSDHLPMALGFMPFALGANLGVHTEVARSLGGWATELRDGGDDVDFAWRAQLAGNDLVFESGASIQYRLRGDKRAALRQSYRYGQADPALYARFRQHGLSRSGPPSAVKIWAGIVADLTRGPQRRAEAQRRAAHHAGRLRGSIRHRVWML